MHLLNIAHKITNYRSLPIAGQDVGRMTGVDDKPMQNWAILGVESVPLGPDEGLRQLAGQMFQGWHCSCQPAGIAVTGVASEMITHALYAEFGSVQRVLWVRGKGMALSSWSTCASRFWHSFGRGLATWTT